MCHASQPQRAKCSIRNQQWISRQALLLLNGKSALLWTEALTLIAPDRVPDAVFAQVRPHFTDEELADLTCAIATINAWNRFAISFRDVPGHYTPSH